MFSGLVGAQAGKARKAHAVFLMRRSASALVRTTMSPTLPPEILDLIIDHLYDEPKTLKACCVVSKSWIHRTRVHLFARVEFHAPKSHIELWKKAFPDPSNSPAHHTRTLSIYGIPLVSTSDTGVGGWIRTFCNLGHLYLDSIGGEDCDPSLVPFYGVSPTLRSLRLRALCSEVLGLICSFPLLEDLTFDHHTSVGDTWDTPSTSPKLTGFLNMRGFGTALSVARQLLGLPDGLHFTKIAFACIEEDVKPAMDLVSACSGTLESLTFWHLTPGTFISASMSGQYLTTICGFRRVWDASG
jgi:hypothetical protein